MMEEQQIPTNTTKPLSKNKNKLLIITLIVLGVLAVICVIVILAILILKSHVDKTQMPSPQAQASNPIVPPASNPTPTNIPAPSTVKYIIGPDKIYSFDQNRMTDITASSGLPAHFRSFSFGFDLPYQELSNSSLLISHDYRIHSAGIFYFDQTTRTARLLKQFTEPVIAGNQSYDAGIYDPTSNIMYVLDNNKGIVHKFDLTTNTDTSWAMLGYKFLGGREVVLGDESSIQFSADRNYMVSVITDLHVNTHGNSIPNISLVDNMGHLVTQIDGTFPRWISNTQFIYYAHEISRPGHTYDRKIYKYDITTHAATAITTPIASANEAVASLVVANGNAIYTKFDAALTHTNTYKVDLTIGTSTIVDSAHYIFAADQNYNLLGVSLLRCNDSMPSIACPPVGLPDYVNGYILIQSGTQTDLLTIDPAIPL